MIDGEAAQLASRSELWQLSTEELAVYRTTLDQRLTSLADQYEAVRREYPSGRLPGEALDRLAPIDDAIEVVRGLIDAANPGSIHEARLRAAGELPWQQTRAQYVAAHRLSLRPEPRSPERAITRAVRHAVRAGHLAESGAGLVRSQDAAGDDLIKRCGRRREAYTLALLARDREKIDARNVDWDNARYHYEAVEEALALGEPVTEEVLRDYPSLAPRFVRGSCWATGR